MASTSPTPGPPEDGADTRPESIAPAVDSKGAGESASESELATASTPAPKKRRKSVRTALRQTLNNSIKQATGRLGDTTNGSNTLAVGSSTMEVETELSGSRAGRLGRRGRGGSGIRCRRGSFWNSWGDGGRRRGCLGAFGGLLGEAGLEEVGHGEQH